MADTATTNSNSDSNNLNDSHNRSLDTSGAGSSNGAGGNGDGCDSAISGADHNDSTATNGKDNKRQQFTIKQRMDMYAFCVLELEMHSNKVSIKKQQQAIQRVLAEQLRAKHKIHEQDLANLTPAQRTTQLNLVSKKLHQEYQQQLERLNGSPDEALPVLAQLHQATMQTPNNTNQPQQQDNSRRSTDQVSQDGAAPHQQNHEPAAANSILNQIEEAINDDGDNDCGEESLTGGKTLLELQQEVARTRKCYSDYQKTQVLTSAMLREVQQRFAKYYPDSTVPSRSTIKHVFEKCVSHGTVENIKTPRRATKITRGDEIEYLLVHEPQLSLRQLAQKLKVSTGTVSRRCKALGLIPESVTIKHQQLATARRQKQIKKLGSKSSGSPSANNRGSALNQGNSTNQK